MNSACSRSGLLPAAAALLAVLSPALGAAQVLNRDAEIIVQVESSAPPRQLDGRSVEILENGQPREVLAVEPIEERWRVVVYFDLPGSTPEGIEAAAAAVGNAADALVTLGDVEKGFAEADLVIEKTFRTKTVHQGYIEPHTATAWW